MVPHHPKIIICYLPTWAIPEKCECQERISLEGKGGKVWNFLTFYQNVVTINRRLKLQLAKLLTHSSCRLGATGHEQMPVEGFPSLHLNNTKMHKNSVSMPNSLSPALMDHCFFLCPFGKRTWKWFSLESSSSSINEKNLQFPRNCSEID